MIRRPMIGKILESVAYSIFILSFSQICIIIRYILDKFYYWNKILSYFVCVSYRVNRLVHLVVANATDEQEVVGSIPGAGKVLLGFLSGCSQ